MTNKEALLDLPVETDSKTLPEEFPISDEGEIYYSNKPDPREGQIVHYRQSVFYNEKAMHRFLLSRTISGLTFNFYLDETGYGDGDYQLSFKTKEYEYAVTNLGAEANRVLLSTIVSFLKSVSDIPEYNIKEVRLSPADASYSAEEINQCLEKVLGSPKNKFSRDELMSEYNGFKIFDLYRELFGHDFLKEHYNRKSRAGGRSRLFRMMIKKYFPDWEIDTKFDFGNDFTLRRKKT